MGWVIHFNHYAMRYGIGLICIFWGVQLLAQQGPSVGGALGGANYLGDFVPGRFFVMRETNPALSLQGRIPWRQVWWLQTNLTYGLLTGSDRAFSEPNWNSNLQFRTHLGEFTFNLEWHPFARRAIRLEPLDGSPEGMDWFWDKEGGRVEQQDEYFVGLTGSGARMVMDRWGNTYRYNANRQLISRSFRHTFSPFLFSGGGLAYGNTRLWGFVEGLDGKVNRQVENTFFSLPMGAGIRYGVNERWSVALQGGMRAIFSDEIDASSVFRNPSRGDWYFLGAVQVHVRLGYRPPSTILPTDTDQDGIPDLLDECRTVGGQANLQGCPDADWDGVPDHIDKCPYLAGKLVDQGCPVTPPAVTDVLPPSDADADGTPDLIDLCPETVGPRELNGCPDSDGDLVPDILDECPTVYGLAPLQGCPPGLGRGVPISAIVLPVVSFTDPIAILDGPGRMAMDQVLRQVQTNPQYYLRLDAFSSQVGGNAENRMLSLNFAKSCYDYLVNHGVDPLQLFYDGHSSVEAIPSGVPARSAGWVKMQFYRLP